MLLFCSGFPFKIKNAKSPYIWPPWKLFFICKDNFLIWSFSSPIRNNFCFWRIYHENWWWYTSSRAICNQISNFDFQGCHIHENSANFKHNGNPDQKNNIRFTIFMVKNHEIWNLFFRVPKKGMSGMPYFTRGQHNFSKNIFLSILVLFRVTWHRNLTWELNVR